MSFGSPAARRLSGLGPVDFVYPPFGGVTLLGTFLAPPREFELSRNFELHFPQALLYIIPSTGDFRHRFLLDFGMIYFNWQMRKKMKN